MPPTEKTAWRTRATYILTFILVILALVAIAAGCWAVLDQESQGF